MESHFMEQRDRMQRSQVDMIFKSTSLLHLCIGTILYIIHVVKNHLQYMHSLLIILQMV